MNSTLSLLISLMVAIQVSMPIGTYLLFNGRHDDKTRLWLLAISLMGIAGTLASLRPILPVFWSYQVVWLLIAASMLLMIEVMRRELGRTVGSAMNWLIHGVVMLCWFVYALMIYVYGLTQSLGVASNGLMMVLLGSVLFVLLCRLYRQGPSKSLKLLGIGVLLYVVPPLIRLVAYLGSGDPQSQDVLQFSLVTNVMVFSFVVAILFISLGYWGFTLEKSMRERNLARAGQQVAEDDAEAMRQLVQERDQLLVINSRISAVSGLSSFSALMIHDISQPLQTLQLGLERIRKRLAKGVNPEQIAEDLKHLEHASDRAGTLVATLRHLMKSGRSQAIAVWLKPLFEQVDGILHGEALQKHAHMVFENLLAPETQVLAEPVMLQRILINVIANSLNQFRQHPVDAPTVSIVLAPEIMNNTAGVSIIVSDNGGGFPEALLERIGQPWSSDRPDGMGMALMLSKQMIGIWGGQLVLSNRTDGIEGAVVKIWLKQTA